MRDRQTARERKRESRTTRGRNSNGSSESCQRSWGKGTRLLYPETVSEVRPSRAGKIGGGAPAAGKVVSVRNYHHQPLSSVGVEGSSVSGQ